MKRISTLLIVVLVAGPLMACDGRATLENTGSEAKGSEKANFPNLRQSAPGELRISPNNDSR